MHADQVPVGGEPYVALDAVGSGLQRREVGPDEKLLVEVVISNSTKLPKGY